MAILSPQEINGLRVWYNASAIEAPDGSIVESWPDSLGTTNYDLTVAPESLENPVLMKNEYKNPVVRFDNAWMTVNFRRLFSMPNTIVIVARINDPDVSLGYIYDGITSTRRHGLVKSTDNVLFALTSGSEYLYTSYEPPPDKLFTASTVYNGPSSSIRIDGDVHAVGNLPGADLSGFYVNGAYPSTPYYANSYLDVGDLLLFDRALTESEIADLESYFWRKYYAVDLSGFIQGRSGSFASLDSGQEFFLESNILSVATIEPVNLEKFIDLSGWVSPRSDFVSPILFKSLTLNGRIFTESRIESSLDRSRPLSGIIETRSVLYEAPAVIERNLGGQIISVTKGSGELSVNRMLTGSIESASRTFSADLPIFHTLESSVLVSSFIRADLIASKPVEGFVQSKSTATGELTASWDLTGSIHSASILRPLGLPVFHPFEASSSGNSIVTEAFLESAVSLFGEVRADSTIEITIETDTPLSGSIFVNTSLTLSIRTDKPLGGSLSATSVVSENDLLIERDLLSVSIFGVSAAASELTVDHSLIGSAEGNSSLPDGTLIADWSLSGGIFSASTLSQISITQDSELAGELRSDSKISDLPLTLTLAYSGAVNGKSKISIPTLEGFKPLDGSISSATSIVSRIDIWRDLTGLISPASVTESPQLERLYRLSGFIEVNSKATGTALGDIPLTGLSAGYSTSEGRTTLAVGLYGSTAIYSSLTGDLPLTVPLLGRSGGSSFIDHVLSRIDRDLNGRSGGIASVSSALLLSSDPIATQIRVTSRVSELSIFADVTLDGSSPGRSDLARLTVRAERGLFGRIESNADILGFPAADYGVSASIQGRSSIDASLALDLPLFGPVFSRSSVSPSLLLRDAPLFGEIAAESGGTYPTLRINFVREIDLSASIFASSRFDLITDWIVEVSLTGIVSARSEVEAAQMDMLGEIIVDTIHLLGVFDIEADLPGVMDLFAELKGTVND